MTITPKPSAKTPDTKIYERRESGVRSYSRSMPRQFNKAQGVWMHANDGSRYLDFLSGCSSLNYGHNHPALKQALMDYIASDGVTHALDLYTDAKAEFLTTFEDVILKPRGLDYRAMFTGPTGTNAVEAAIKLARKVTGRETVIAFTNGFHGMTLGALACTGNAGKRGGAGVPLSHVSHEPYDGYYGADVAAQDRRARQEAGRADDRRRHPGRLRPHRRLLQLRGHGFQARYRHAGQVSFGYGPAFRADPVQPRPRRVVAG